MPAPPSLTKTATTEPTAAPGAVSCAEPASIIALERSKTAMLNILSDLAAEKHLSDSRVQALEKTKRAMLNILEDLALEKRLSDDQRGRLQAIFTSIDDGLFVLDTEDRVLMANRAAFKLVKARESEIVGALLPDLCQTKAYEPGAKQPEWPDVLHSDATGRAGHRIRCRLVNQHSQEIPVSLSTTPLLDDSGQRVGSVSVWRDITEEAELDLAKSEFVSLASHQLRTPLTAINWYAETLAEDPTTVGTRTGQDAVNAISVSARRMALLVNALLNTSRIDTRRLQVKPVTDSLADITKEVVAEQQLTARQSNVSTKVTVSPRVKPLPLDPVLIRIVIQNLVGNAIRYSRAGQTVAVSLKLSGRDTMFEVVDQGIGVPIKDQNQIFEKLFRASNATQATADGTGLGLYISKAVINLAGGEIGFESQIGQGSRFWFRLPPTGMRPIAGTHTLTPDAQVTS